MTEQQTPHGEIDWRRRVRDAFAPHGPDDDVIEELAQHARQAYDTARGEGESRTEAIRQVDVQIALWAGDAGLLRRRSTRLASVPPPSSGSRSWLDGAAQDVRYAARVVRRQAGFSLLVITIMALGIAAATTLFSVAYGVLLKPLAWPESDRLIVVKETRGGHRPRFNSFSNAAYRAWREAPSTLEAIAAWSPRILTLTGAGDPARIRVAAVTASLFDVLRVQPLVGNVFQEADERIQPPALVVLSERLWRERFSADPALIGRSIHLEGSMLRVVGVLPDHAAYPDRETLAWVPFHVAPATGNFLSMFEAIARLRPSVTAAQAASEGTARGQHVPDTAMTTMAIFGGTGPVEVAAVSLHDALTSDVRRPVFVLMAAVVLLLATAIANVASLQLARATARRRDMAIRAALGAGGARLTRQLLFESLILGCGGAFVGVALAVALHRALPSILPADFPRLTDVELGLPAIVFACAASVLGALTFGMAPALRARRLNLVESLSDDGAAPAGGRTRTGRARLAIMAGQVAVACILLVGASLFGRSFVKLLNADRGFDPANVLTARLQLPGFAYTPERRAEFVDRTIERLRAVPSVTAVTYSDGPPLGIFGGTAFMLDGRQVQASARTVTPGYFAGMGMRLLAGRDFTDEDVATNRAVFIVNRSFARQYLRSDPVGQRVSGWVREGRGDWEIIGLVDDVRHRGATEPGEPEIYRYRPRSGYRLSVSPTLIVRTAGDPTLLIPTLRAIVRQQDASVVLDSLMTMEDRLLTGLARPRLYAVLLGGFAALALIIAAAGLFGVLSYTVAQRSREIAMRTALGARPFDIVTLVVRQALIIAATGAAVGVPAAMAMAGTVRATLYGVSAMDPLTYVIVPMLLLAATLVACVIPARRASRLDPLRVLKAG